MLARHSLRWLVLPFACYASAAQAQVVFQDSFELGAFDTAWAIPNGETVGATIVSGGVAGSTNSAHVNGSGTNVLGHGLGEGNELSDWVLEFNFQLSAATETGRYFNLHIGSGADTPTNDGGLAVSTGTGAASINLRYQQDSGSEGFDVYNGATAAWVSLRTGSTIGRLGSVSRNEWQHLRIEGFGWGTPDYSYSITLTLADNSAHTVSGLRFYQNGNPSAWEMDGFNFNRGFGFPASATYQVDNVVLTAVPEPASISALLMGVGLLGMRRRRVLL